MKKIYLSTPHMTGKEKEYINQSFESNWVAPLGPNVDHFEKEITQYVGSKDAVALSSGTAAIHLALNLLGVGKGDTVFCSTLTFIASANPIVYQGATPIFIDSEPDTWNISPAALEKALDDAKKNNKLPKAVIVVHLFGQPAKLDEILNICGYYSIPIIEDAAESMGSLYKGKQTGTFGEFGIYSFNGNKIITTSGGGALVSDNLDELKRARFLAAQAREPEIHYEHKYVGYNYRMSNLLAGVGRAQLEGLEERIHLRRKVFERYMSELGNIPGIEFMPELKETKSNRWLTALTMDSKIIKISPNKLIKFLSEKNIEARPIWKPLHLQPVFKDYHCYNHFENKNFSIDLFNRGICIPSGSNLTLEDQYRVIENFKIALELGL
ncbi:aminotransferase class I/II-fold pyridoxal phosphate-dependent enzyme [Bacillus sp. DTU_2020_1000418_1_SI_GHA_SEK_038]|uniref:aminotransferase class I/II-fold pyridoxal phosphate-dependent enzyme n=1 Tax=Bacillus sp. DTU_2020_1000418_1_SI_GHA_SEK_038 TaxID=3077585 RepID=UPI0028E6DE18|nr:aminotransferase class I/II-fold pyridoxal phosphate-dependent enzyme [Bacillus sp. DTU_2020_1000418_1_SI_GHA_SEK_038]WNS74814.1 aminotransferase class I/II-fold pyridoxal phosphate-dependent enzyme [Bacillus sp. DTU_2020_1000418_1_SI_GHA_SEK_038]